MGKSSRRNRPSKAQRKKNAIVARNNNYYNIVLCKSTNKASRGITGGPDRNDANLMKQFKRDKVRDRYVNDTTSSTLVWSPLI